MKLNQATVRKAAGAVSLATMVADYQRKQSEVERYLKVGKQIRGTVYKAQSELQRRFGYTLHVDDDDWAYSDLLTLVQEQLPPQRVMSVTADAKCGWDDDDNEYVKDVKISVGDLAAFDQRVEIGGHKMRVRLTRGGPPMPGQPSVPAGLYFYTRNVAGKDAVLGVMREITARRVSKPELRDPCVYVMKNGNSWRSTNAPSRPVDSVILPAGQMERITEDMKEFLDNERFYTHRSIPWHRGYLFHGPPGTGKTSLVRGLAKMHGLDLYTVPLGDIKQDSDLAAIVSEIRYRAILLLEDIDVYATVTEREGHAGSATLSGLLNTLDGVSTPHGLITVMTTNCVDQLDAALLRPGRIDVVEEISAPGPEQARRLFEYFYEREAKADWSKVHRESVAEIVEVFKRHLRDADAAEAEMTKAAVSAVA